METWGEKLGFADSDQAEWTCWVNAKLIASAFAMVPLQEQSGFSQKVKSAS